MGTSKGHNKYIETPEKMQEYFDKYKKEVKENPRTKREYVGKDGNSVDTPLERPLTMSGFQVFMYDKVGVIHQYFVNQGNRYGDYVNVCTRIRTEIRQDQIEGGMVGQYNSSITQRLNGLVDKQQTEIKKEPRVFNLNDKKEEE